MSKKPPISTRPGTAAGLSAGVSSSIPSVGASVTIHKAYAVGERVLVNKCVGEVMYVGTTKFSTGVWVGIALDQPLGKNDGSVQGEFYFTCHPNHGIFLREDSSQIVRVSSEKKPSSKIPTTKSNIISPRNWPSSGPSPRSLSTSHSAASSDLLSRTDTLSIPENSSVHHSPRSEANEDYEGSSDIPDSVLISDPTNEAVSSLTHHYLHHSQVSDHRGTFDSHPIQSTSTHSYSLSETVLLNQSSHSQVELQRGFTGSNIESNESLTHAVNLSDQLMNSVSNASQQNTDSSQTMQSKTEEYNRIRSLQQQLEETREQYQKRIDELVLQKQQAQDSQHQKIETLASKLKDVTSERDTLRIESLQQERRIKELEVSVETLELDLESATLDQEMNVVRLEELEREAASLREENSLLGSQLRVLKESKTVEGGGPSISEYEGMKEQYTKLKQALILLRDKSVEDKKDIATKTKELEVEQRKVNELKEKNEYLTQDLEKARQDFADAMEQLEAVEENDIMIESLTEKNLTLNEKLKEMEVVVSELKELRDLSEAIEQDNEKRLQDLTLKTISKDAEIEDQKTAIQNLANEVSALRAEIDRYRHLTQKLQYELNQYRSSVESQEMKIMTTDKQYQDTMADNIRLQGDLNRMRKEIMHSHLAQYRAEEVEHEIEFIKLCIPQGLLDNYLHDFSCVQSLERILHKICLLQKATFDNYSMVWVDDSPIPSIEPISVYENVSLLTAFSRKIEIFLGLVLSSKENSFVEYIRYTNGMIATETYLDFILERIYTKQVSPAEIEKTAKLFIHDFNNIFMIYNLVPDSIVKDSYTNYVQQSLVLIRTSVTLLFGLKQQFMTIAISQQNIVDFMEHVNPAIKVVEDLCASFTGILDKMQLCQSQMKATMADVEVDANTSRSFNYLRTWHFNFNSKLRSAFDSLAVHKVDYLGQAVNLLTQISGSGDDEIMSQLPSIFRYFAEFLQALTRMNDSSNLLSPKPVAKEIAVELKEKADHMKFEITNAVGYKVETERIRTQLTQVVESLREKERIIKHIQSQLQGSEKRINQMQEKYDEADLNIQKLKKRESELLENTKKQDTEIQALEDKCRKLQEQATKVYGQTRVSAIIGEHANSHHIVATLQYLRAENITLKNERVKSQLLHMSPLVKVAPNIATLAPLHSGSSSEPRNLDLSEAIRDIRKDSYNFCSGLKIVSLDVKGTHPLAPTRQLQEQKATLQGILQRQEQLRVLLSDARKTSSNSFAEVSF